MSGYILDARGIIVGGGDTSEGYMGKECDDDVLMCAAPELLDVLRSLFKEAVADDEGAPHTLTLLKAKELIERLDQ